MGVRRVICEGDGDSRHGTENGYNNLDCRCPACTAAHRERHRRYMNADPARLAKHALRQRLRSRANRRAADFETRTGTPARETN